MSLTVAYPKYFKREDFQISTDEWLDMNDGKNLFYFANLKIYKQFLTHLNKLVTICSVLLTRNFGQNNC